MDAISLLSVRLLSSLILNVYYHHIMPSVVSPSLHTTHCLRRFNCVDSIYTYSEMLDMCNFRIYRIKTHTDVFLKQGI